MATTATPYPSGSGGQRPNIASAAVRFPAVRDYEQVDSEIAGLEGYVSGDRANKGVLHSLPIVDNLMASKRVLERRFWVARSEVPDSQALIDGLAVKGTIWQLPGTLSGGTQQKLLIARWTHLEPAVLVLEEPTRGVDIGTKREIYAQIRELATRGTTVIWWSTEAVELVEVCDCVLAFDPDGRPTRVVQRDDISEEGLAEATGMAA